MLRKHRKLTGMAMVAITSLMLSFGALASRRIAAGEKVASLAHVPGAVRAPLPAWGGTIDGIGRESKDDPASHEADIIIGGQKFELKVPENSSLLRKQIDDEDDKN